MHWGSRKTPPLAALLGLDLTRVLQGGQDYQFIGPLPHAGDILHAETSVESVTEKSEQPGWFHDTDRGTHPVSASRWHGGRRRTSNRDQRAVS